MKAVWLRGVDCSSTDNSFTGDCNLQQTPTGYGECISSDLAAVTCGEWWVVAVISRELFAC